MRSFQLTVKDSGSDCESVTHVQIPDDEFESLVAFADAADEFAGAEILKQELHVQLKIKFDAKKGVAISGTLPSDDAISALLHRVRPFVLAKEPTSFLRTRNILSKHLCNSQMREILDRQRDMFTGKEFQQQIEIVTTTPVLNDVLNSDESFHLWLNAFEYHRDTDKRATVEQLCGVLGFEAARAIFVSMLLDKIRAIMNLAVIIRRCQLADGQPLKVGS